MTSCFDPADFETIDGALEPHEYLQWRHVATAFVAGSETSYPRSATGRNDLLHTVQAAWTNTTPIAQLVYGLVTRGGSMVVFGPRNRAGIAQWHGIGTGVAPADPATLFVSRHGGGVDTGTAGINNYLDYAIYEDRQGPRTAFLGTATNIVLPPGQQIKGRVDIRFVTDSWSGANVDGGNTEGVQTSTVVSGSTRVDLYAIPVLS
jgi:hypothetical protein